MRVIVDNDFSGDPDDLFQLAHHLLSPSVEVPFVIASHLAPGDGLDPSAVQAENAARKVEELLSVMGWQHQIRVVTGSDTGLTSPHEPIRSAAAFASRMRVSYPPLRQKRRTRSTNWLLSSTGRTAIAGRR